MTRREEVLLKKLQKKIAEFRKRRFQEFESANWPELVAWSYGPDAKTLPATPSGAICPCGRPAAANLNAPGLFRFWWDDGSVGYFAPCSDPRCKGVASCRQALKIAARRRAMYQYGTPVQWRDSSGRLRVAQKPWVPARLRYNKRLTIRPNPLQRQRAEAWLKAKRTFESYVRQLDQKLESGNLPLQPVSDISMEMRKFVQAAGANPTEIRAYEQRVNGRSYGEIAVSLGIKRRAAQTLVESVYRKIDKHITRAIKF